MVEKAASVLFADRDLEWSRATRAELRGRGHSVFAARSSRDVLEMAARHAPDVIVLDDGLEELGVEVLMDLLRSQSPHSKIILLADGENLKDRRPLHASACLARPVSPEILLDTVVSSFRSAPDEASRNPLVFCVDDDPAFLRGLSRLLRRHGYDVLPFESSESALAAVPFVKPDLFILDVRMPGMNGLDLAAEIQEREEAPRPLVFLTAAGSDEEISRGYQSGAAGYLVKPCDPHAVVELADRILGGRAGEA